MAIEKKSLISSNRVAAKKALVISNRPEAKVSTTPSAKIAKLAAIGAKFAKFKA